MRDPRARDLLERAIAGRGAFRRFKDTLFDFPELRKSWFAFHDARMIRRALQWLADEGLIDLEIAEREILAHPDPDLPSLGEPFDPLQIARDVEQDLRELYGARLRQVILFGSWARGDAHPESDIDLLVVLDRVGSPWSELRRMEKILWRHSIENDTVVTALPVGEADLETPRSPAVMRARLEGRPGGDLKAGRLELSKSRQELDAARLLAEKGFGRQAVSRAYFAAFYAAEATLSLMGETRSKHAGVIAAFGKLFVREGGLSEEVGRLLRSLFERRNEADYTGSEPSDEESLATVQDVERFVGALEVWMADKATKIE